jgi:hypothetical protein
MRNKFLFCCLFTLIAYPTVFAEGITVYVSERFTRDALGVSTLKSCIPSDDSTAPPARY